MIRRRWQRVKHVKIPILFLGVKGYADLYEDNNKIEQKIIYNFKIIREQKYIKVIYF